MDLLKDMSGTPSSNLGPPKMNLKGMDDPLKKNVKGNTGHMNIIDCKPVRTNKLTDLSHLYTFIG